MTNQTVEQAWLRKCESFAQATAREWSANDERTYRLGLELIASVRAATLREVEQALRRHGQWSNSDDPIAMAHSAGYIGAADWCAAQQT